MLRPFGIFNTSVALFNFHQHPYLYKEQLGKLIKFYRMQVVYLV